MVTEEDSSMATSSSSPYQPKFSLKFIGSSRGKKLLVLDGHIFHFHSRNKHSSYFKCARRKTKGCAASITVRNWNPTNYTFKSYKVTNAQHTNHLPDLDKLRRIEDKKNKEKAQVDLNSAEFRNKKYVCLFCFASLPPNYLDIATLENVVPYGKDLSIVLDNPTKNSQAFDLLCSLLNVKWRRYPEGRHFDQTIVLPLCVKCQNLYQEVFQLHLQIRELEVLLNKRINVIRGIVERSEEEQGEIGKGTIGETQLALLGLDAFRKKVTNPNYNRIGCDGNAEGITSCTKSQRPPKKERGSMKTDSSTVTTQIKSEIDHKITENVTAPPSLANLTAVVKEEVNELEDNYDDMTSNVTEWDGDSISNELEINYDNDDVGVPIGSDESRAGIIPKTRTRSTRLAAQKASGKVGKYVTSDDDGSDDKEYERMPLDSDSDSEPKRIKRVTTRLLSAASMSRPNRLKRKAASSFSSAPNAFKKSYTCNICSAVVLGSKTFWAHYKQEHPGRQRYSCKFCGKHYITLRDVVVHQRTHTGEKPFKCSLCDFASHQKSSVSSHFSRRHTDRSHSDETHSCPECEKEFPSKTTLNNHLTASHGKIPDTKFYKKSGKPIKTITCHLCDAKVIGQGPFLQHYKEFHPEEKRYTCKFCKVHCRYIREILEHQRRHTGEKPFKCDQCDKTFANGGGLRSHRRFRHAERTDAYPCSKCDKKFPCKSARTAHMYVHNKILSFCKSCGKGFRYHSLFMKHNRKQHDGLAELSRPVSDPGSMDSFGSLGVAEVETTLKCHICWVTIQAKIFIPGHFKKFHPDHSGGVNTCQCGKRFKSYKHCCNHSMRHSKQQKTLQCDQCPHRCFNASELRMHLATHVPVEERQRNHVCDICGIGVVSDAALVTHKKRHEETNKMRWVCEQCGKSYAEKRGLDHHTKTEHLQILPHKCDKCEKRFPLRSILRKHERIHLGFKPFKCSMCETAFVHPTSRSRHMREVHNVGGEDRQTPRKKKSTRTRVRRVKTISHDATGEMGSSGSRSGGLDTMEEEKPSTACHTPPFHTATVGHSATGVSSNIPMHFTTTYTQQQSHAPLSMSSTVLTTSWTGGGRGEALDRAQADH